MSSKIYFYVFIALLSSSCQAAAQTPLPKDQWQPLPAWAEYPEDPEILSLEQCNDPFALVDRAHQLPVEQCPTDVLVDPNTVGIDAFDNQRIYSGAAESMRMLFEAAAANGYFLRISSGWRDCAYQENVFSSWVQRGNGDENFANTYTYHCGASSHHTGWVVDILFGEVNYGEGFGLTMGDTQTYTWLVENAGKFGCALEYPEGKAELTGLNWEPWHWRCGIPSDVAEKVNSGEFTLAEWLRDNEN